MRKIFTTFLSLFLLSASTFAQSDLTAGLVGDYYFSGNANDASSQANNGTVNGATLTTDRFGKTNSAYNFNGLDNYISLPVTNFLLSYYTYSVWVNIDVNPSVNQVASILSIGQIAGDQGIMLGNQYPSGAANTGFLVAGNNSSTNNSSSYVGTLPTTSKWYHVAATRSSTEMKLYIDGILVKTTTVPNAAYYGSGSSQMANIGTRSHENKQYFNGSIDDVKIYNRALSDCEVAALASLTSNESSVANYPFNENADDASGNGIDGTVSGATLTTDRFGDANRAYSFNGISDYVSLPVTNLLLDNYTYSVWANVNAIPSTNSAASILTIGQTAGDQGIFLGNQYPSGTANTGFFVAGNNSSTTNSSCYAGTLPTTSTWYHLVMVRSSSEMKLYINGSLVKTTTVPNAAYYGASSDPKAIIGARSHGDKQYFNGKIDDIKIFNRELVACEIKDLFDEEKVVTATMDAVLDEAVKLYPNPNDGKFTVEFPSSTSVANVTIHNSLGLVVYQEILSASKSFELNNLSSGIYVFKLKADGKEMTRKFVIK